MSDQLMLSFQSDTHQSTRQQFDHSSFGSSLSLTFGLTIHRLCTQVPMAGTIPTGHFP